MRCDDLMRVLRIGIVAAVAVLVAAIGATFVATIAFSGTPREAAVGKLAEDLAVFAPTLPGDAAVVVLSSNGRGSGVYLGNGRILTARHVVDDDTDEPYVDVDRLRFPATVMWTDKGADMTVLAVKHVETMERMIGTAAFTCDIPPRGAAVIGVGYPEYFGKVILPGVVGSGPFEAGSWLRAVAVSIGSGPGSSGGPVYVDGRVFGIVVGAAIGTNNLVIVSLIAPICGKFDG